MVTWRVNALPEPTSNQSRKTRIRLKFRLFINAGLPSNVSCSHRYNQHHPRSNPSTTYTIFSKNNPVNAFNKIEHIHDYDF